MKVALSTIGTFHSFDLARELHAAGQLVAIFTGYPAFKLRGESLPGPLIRTYPWLHAPYMAMPRREWLGRRALLAWEYLDRVMLDRHVASKMPACDVFVGLSSSALHSGLAAQAMGARYVCDRGSSHIQEQDELLRDEHAIWGQPYEGIDPRIIDRELREYEAADCITVPSGFNVGSFVKRGVAASKLRRLPYGVNLSRFHPVGEPAADRFDILFAGGMHLRKGVPYLLQAYRDLKHPRKSLTFAGAPSQDLIELMRARGLWPEDARVLGHVPQQQLKEIMSRSHVMVLPSIEEGLALVQAQAMACACPVIGTDHTGAQDLFEDGQQGYIVPVRQAGAIAERLQQLADDPDLRKRLSQQALLRVRGVGGWQSYGEQARAIYQGLLQ
jgi:starch synthase